MKNHLLALTLAILILFPSCTYDPVPGISLSNCPPDIKLGSFELQDESFSFFPYTERDTLIFLDQDNIEHTLIPTEYIELSDTRIVVVSHCDKNFLIDGEQEYYATKRKKINLEDVVKGGRITLNLTTKMTNKDSLESSVVYDNFYMGCETHHHGNINSAIITSVHEEYNNGLAPSPYNLASFIGDTTINSRVYENVYRGKGDNGKFYYNKLNGILMIDSGPDDYLVLKN